jgi:hypothetical protein
MFLYPTMYFVFYLIVTNLFDMSYITQVIYLISLPVSGFYAYSFSKYLKHISYKWKYMLLMISENKAMLELKEKRNELRTLIFERN